MCVSVDPRALLGVGGRDRPLLAGRVRGFMARLVDGSSQGQSPSTDSDVNPPRAGWRPAALRQTGAPAGYGLVKQSLEPLDEVTVPKAAGLAALSSCSTARGFLAAAACFVLAACSASPGSKIDPRLGVSASPKVVADGEPVPPGGGRYKVGKPYVIAGRTYFPREDSSYDRTGTASWYGVENHGRLTANGEVFDRQSISAAHPTMPIPSYARVTNRENGMSIIVRVNDRGPYAGNRMVDLSERAADLLRFKGRGLANVRVQYIGKAGLEGSDQRMLLASLAGPDRPPSLGSDRIMVARADLDGNEAATRPQSPAVAERPIMVAAAMVPVSASQQTTRADVGTPILPPYPKPASSSAEIIARSLGGADGPPLLIMPPDVDDILPRPAAVTGAALTAPAPQPQPIYRWQTPLPGNSRTSYAAGDLSGEMEPRISAAHAIFAAVDRSQSVRLDGARPTSPIASVRIDLGAYRDRARAEKLATRFAAFGSVTLGRAGRNGLPPMTTVSLAAEARLAPAILAAARSAGVSDAHLIGR